jgi:DNA polymerase
MAVGGPLDTEDALKALLDYYRALGVDCAVDEAPHDRFAELELTPVLDERAELKLQEAPVPPPPRRAPSAAPVFPQEAIRDAEGIAAAARTLEELCEGLEAFEGGRASRARHFLFSSGRPGALMALDYAPGEAEESSGEAFSGPEARLLDAMLAAIGETRESFYRAYFSPWRPAGGQPLTPHVAAALTPFARRHIELARPKAVLLFGDTAKIMLGVSDAPMKLYARRFDLRLGETNVVAIPAPGLAAMLKTSSLKRQAWRALRAVKQALRD